MLKDKLISCLLLLVPFSWALNCNISAMNSSKCVITNNGIGLITLGDPENKIYDSFKDKYKIIEQNKVNEVKLIKLYDGKKVIMQFTIDDKRNIWLIDIYNNCITAEGIGCGSSLLSAKKAYGKGKISPTDQGYFVFFEKKEGIAFLLNNDDIPKRLRFIPDDVFDDKEENEILKIDKARIVCIQLFFENVE